MSNINEAPSTGDSNMSLQRIPCRNVMRYFRYFILKNDDFDGQNGDATSNDKMFSQRMLSQTSTKGCYLQTKIDISRQLFINKMM